MTDSLSLPAARKIILNHQGLNNRTRFGRGIDGTLKAIEHLSYVQIDTLSVVARAHLHTLWNRVAGFKPTDIDSLQEQGKVFEHWAHALAILPMRDYRFSLPMMQRMASADGHWYPRDGKLMKKVLQRIREEGPLAAKDFSDKKSSNAMWARSASKIALEQLFMEGELMIPRRLNFHKVYDLRERVLPDDIDASMPSSDQLCRHLIDSCLRAQGLAQIAEVSYLRKGLTAQMSQTARDMEEQGLIRKIEVAEKNYFIKPHVLDDLGSPTVSPKLRVLSPFDNAVIQRKRLASLFAFEYQIECYVPKAKRKFGYFCLPVMRGNRFLARLDAKADRRSGVFHVMNLYLEPAVRKKESLLAALQAELLRFAKFDGCDSVKLHAINHIDS
jgi:uncharacterized protein